MYSLPATLSRAVRPNYIAGYIAWLVVFTSIWRSHVQWSAIGPVSGVNCAILLLSSFLIAFAALSFLGDGSTRQGSAAATVIVLLLWGTTIGLLLLGPSSFSPILLIVIAVVLMTVYQPWTAWGMLLAINLSFVAVLVFWWRVEVLCFVGCRM